MSRDLRAELKEFEKELAHVIARFLTLYDRLEREVPPENRRPAAPSALLARAPEPPGALPGYQ